MAPWLSGRLPKIPLERSSADPMQNLPSHRSTVPLPAVPQSKRPDLTQLRLKSPLES